MAILVSSPNDLRKYISEEDAPELFEYLRSGGILRIKGDKDGIIVTYPSKSMITARIKELEEKKREIIYELAKLKRLGNNKRLLDPLKVKHHLLSVIDGSYREIAALIDIEKLLRDERGRRIVDRLQKDLDYRKRLKETLSESPVYKSSPFGSFVDKTEEVKGALLSERIQRLERAIRELNREIDILKKLKNWLK